MGEVLLGDIHFPDVTPEFHDAGRESTVNEQGDVIQSGVIRPARIVWTGKLTDSSVAVARNIDCHLKEGTVLPLIVDGKQHSVRIVDFERLSSTPWLEPHRHIRMVEIKYRIVVYYADTKEIEHGHQRQFE